MVGAEIVTHVPQRRDLKVATRAVNRNIEPHAKMHGRMVELPRVTTQEEGHIPGLGAVRVRRQTPKFQATRLIVSDHPADTVDESVAIERQVTPSMLVV